LQKKPDSVIKSSSQKNNAINVIMKSNRNVQNFLQEGLTFLNQFYLVLEDIFNQIDNKDQSKISNLLLIVDMNTYKTLKTYNEKVKQVKNILENFMQN
jgi:hypothetical protein